jgi:hypothetical protein
VIPDNIKIVSKLPKVISKIDAAPGGKSSVGNFKWTINGLKAGTYEFKVYINTSNCGSKSGISEVTIVEGPSISIPKIFPSKPSVGEAVTVSAEVRSGNKYVEVIQTSLYTWGTTKDYSDRMLWAQENELFLLESFSSQNFSDINDENVSKQRLGSGKNYKMTRAINDNDWRIRIDKFEKEEDIYYWLNIKTSDGKNYTSFVYKITIEDLEEKYLMLESMKWGTFFSIVIGFILIFGISWIYLNKPVKNIKKKGIFVLGSHIISKPFERTTKNVSDLNLVRVRFLLLMIFIIITILLLIISIYLGLFQDLIGETGG